MSALFKCETIRLGDIIQSAAKVKPNQRYFGYSKFMDPLIVINQIKVETLIV